MMEGALKDVFSCGKIISGTGDNIKCGYLVKTRDKFVNQVERCRAMSYTPDPQKPKQKIKTGDLVSIHDQEIVVEIVSTFYSNAGGWSQRRL